MNLYISRKPEKVGGGSNTFAWNFVGWAKRNGHRIVDDIREAERAVVVADVAEEAEVIEARQRGCYVIHRIDEYFEREEDEYRQRKHEKIIALNRGTDVTVFQSEFVRNNAEPFLRPRRYAVIHNGADPDDFRPSSRPGRYIGHVTWSVHARKGLETLYRKIKDLSHEEFWLVGRHKESGIDFRLPNVVLRGVRDRKKIAHEYGRMKLLFFPSENEPCPNIPIEAIVCGVPVCYHASGGTPEVVRDCGAPLEALDDVLVNTGEYQRRCMQRQDLYFDRVFQQYMTV